MASASSRENYGVFLTLKYEKVAKLKTLGLFKSWRGTNPLVSPTFERAGTRAPAVPF